MTAPAMEHLLYNEDGELPVYGYFFENVKNCQELLAQAKAGRLRLTSFELTLDRQTI